MMLQPVIWLERIDKTMEQDGNARLLWRCDVCAQRFQHHRQLMEHVDHAHVAVGDLREDDDRGPTLVVVNDGPLSDVKQDTSLLAAATAFTWRIQRRSCILSRSCWRMMQQAWQLSHCSTTKRLLQLLLLNMVHRWRRRYRCLMMKSLNS